jgi:hypothetical protein
LCFVLILVRYLLSILTYDTYLVPTYISNLMRDEQKRRIIILLTKTKYMYAGYNIYDFNNNYDLQFKIRVITNT